MSFNPQNIAILGASGAIGKAFTKTISGKYPHASIFAFSRLSDIHNIDYYNEDSIAKAATVATKNKPLDLVIVATGTLHNKECMPEKSLKDLSADKFHHLFAVNTVIPALIAKYFLPKMNNTRTAIFAVLSARVGSISDNRLGGWYSYRTSKAALHMMVKTAAIEMTRHNKKSIVVALHPGTVDSNLSKPFQKNVTNNMIFTPQYSAHKLLEVLKNLSKENTGKCFAWDGEEILP